MSETFNLSQEPIPNEGQTTEMPTDPLLDAIDTDLSLHGSIQLQRFKPDVVDPEVMARRREAASKMLDQRLYGSIGFVQEVGPDDIYGD